MANTDDEKEDALAKADENVPAGALQLSDGFNTWNWAATNRTRANSRFRS